MKHSPPWKPVSDKMMYCLSTTESVVAQAEENDPVIRMPGAPTVTLFWIHTDAFAAAMCLADADCSESSTPHCRLGSKPALYDASKGKAESGKRVKRICRVQPKGVRRSRGGKMNRDQNSRI
ncbi:hypothetical protein VN97_g7384 [Penicillium thymicola]|uniref:Uncharacterized protein n=1 Tax=Penicillium thymicola TaxID=293382 RepID=A0AAI9TF84_PENTH|nr:hypothetical protein VN97_g7384 [Penicillium thymicola]